MQPLRKEGISVVYPQPRNYYCSERIIIMKKRLSVHIRARIAIVNDSAD